MARSSFMNVDIVKHQYDRPMTWELIVYDIAITYQSFVEELAADENKTRENNINLRLHVPDIQ